MMSPFFSYALFICLVDGSRYSKYHLTSGFTFHSSSSSSLFATTRRRPQTYITHYHPRLCAQPLNRRKTLQSTSTDGELDTSAIIDEEGDDDIIIPAAVAKHEKEIDNDDAYFDKMFDDLTTQPKKVQSSSSNDDENEAGESEGEECVKLIDFIEQTVGIQTLEEDNEEGEKKRRGRDKPKNKKDTTTTSSQQVLNVDDDIEEVDSNNLQGYASEDGDEVLDMRNPQTHYTASNEFTMASEIAFDYPSSHDLKTQSSIKKECTTAAIMEEQPPPSVNEKRSAPYNVVCTHITADFDTLASAIGLAKLWSLGIYDEAIALKEKGNPVYGPLPTYVVLPRGAHPDVQRFLSLHKHLFPIRSLKSLPGFSDNDLKKGNKKKNSDNPREGLQRVGLVDAQRLDRLGPADILLPHAKLGVTVVDHHMDAESDIEQVRNYVVENVGSVSTMIAERIKSTGVELTEAEATILALGIHSDTGSLVYDSTVGLLIHCLFGSIIST